MKSNEKKTAAMRDPGRQHHGAMLATALGLAAGLGAAHANPSGPSIVQGLTAADIHGLGTARLEIRNQPGAIINWQSFGIDPGEITRFIQQGPDSAILNRVRGQDPSQILGQLQSNGRVYLINPNGIVVGPDAVVDTAGFVASTLAMSDADFRAGRHRFENEGGAQAIENHGYIKAGSDGHILLVAPSITNAGQLVTDGGNLILAAGQAVTITSIDDPALEYEIRAPDDAVVNLGEMIADGGAAAVFGATIRNAGTISANALTVDAAGRVRLVARDSLEITSSGVVSANGADGGEVLVDTTAGDTVVRGARRARGDGGGGGQIEV
ncbi:MAG: two-partner secretion domain-containing protein, partial [Gammaproteobacteria bacterium]